jgi:hypothetical protein
MESIKATWPGVIIWTKSKPTHLILVIRDQSLFDQLITILETRVLSLYIPKPGSYLLTYVVMSCEPHPRILLHL